MSLNRLRNRFWRRYRMLTGRTYEPARLRWLPRTLEYRGEFGLELLVFLPFVRWLSERGLLRERTVSTYKGMEPFYRGIDGVLVERDEKRTFVPPGDRPSFLPVNDEFALTGATPCHRYPELRGMFADLVLDPALEAAIARKPLLIIHNKYTDEWNKGPVNHLDLDTLERLIAVLRDAFTVVYIRHGIRDLPTGYTEDQNDILPFNDLGLIARHPDVLLFDDLLDAHMARRPESNINEFKNALCSRCFRFITSQGGGAHHLAFFSGSIMAILHREGLEENGAYETGFYTFVSDPPPLLLCCPDGNDIVRAGEVIARTRLEGGRISLGAGDEAAAAMLAPGRLRQRRPEETSIAPESPPAT